MRKLNRVNDMKLRLREIREKNDLSGRKIAYILNIGKSTYNYYETGKRIITVEFLQYILVKHGLCFRSYQF